MVWFVLGGIVSGGGTLMARNLGRHKPDSGAELVLMSPLETCRPLAAVALLALIGLILADRAQSPAENASAIKRVSISSPSLKHTSQPPVPLPEPQRRIALPEPQSRVPLPEPELLQRQVAPECDFKAAEQADKYDVAFRVMKLDFEQQCYRQSESILRARMERLQDAVSKTIESINRREHAPSPGNAGERSDRKGARASATTGE
jgi:hypothetical protein